MPGAITVEREGVGGKGGGLGGASRGEQASVFEPWVACGSQGELSSLASWQGQRDDTQDRAWQTDAVWVQEGGGITPKFCGWTALEDLDPPVDAWS